MSRRGVRVVRCDIAANVDDQRAWRGVRGGRSAALLVVVTSGALRRIRVRTAPFSGCSLRTQATVKQAGFGNIG